MIILSYDQIELKKCVDDDDGDNDDDDELLLWYGWQTKGVQLGPFVRDPHRRESSTRREQGCNLRRAWVQALLNVAVQ